MNEVYDTFLRLAMAEIVALRAMSPVEERMTEVWLKHASTRAASFDWSVFYCSTILLYRVLRRSCIYDACFARAAHTLSCYGLAMTSR